MSKKSIVIFALFMLFATAAQSQVVGTYKASKAKAVTQRVEKPRNPLFLGINAGLTGTVGTIKALDYTIGLDLAFSRSKTYAWGFFTGFESPKKANIGLLFVHGNYVEGNTFFWGFGYSYIFKYEKELEYESIKFNRKYSGSKFLLRFGFKPKMPVYFSMTLSYGILKRHDNYGWYDSGSTFSTSFAVGYRINTKRRIK